MQTATKSFGHTVIRNFKRQVRGLSDLSTQEAWVELMPNLRLIWSTEDPGQCRLPVHKSKLKRGKTFSFK